MSVDHPAKQREKVAAPYPKPAIPVKPILSRESHASQKETIVPSLLQSGCAIKVTSGRTALALALQHLGIRPGDQVLVPAYHCTAMIAPIQWASAVPVFYRIHRDTSVELEHLQHLLTPRTRAVIVVHYFGFPQPLTALRTFCDTHRLVLIEDCAHAFFGENAGRPIGSSGEYAITSAMKFFPIYDGGYLVSPNRSVAQIALKSGGLAFEMKSLFNVFEYALEYGRLGLLRPFLRLPMAVKDFIWQRLKSSRHNPAENAIGPSASDGGYDFDGKWLDIRMSWLSRLLIAKASHSRIVASRCANYLKLLEALANVPGIAPLFPNLPKGVVPYMFPAIIADPNRVFPRLKQAGVPVLRFGEQLWPGVEAAECSVSTEYSRHVIQLPCHQSLRPDELDWMIQKIQRALDLE